MIFVIVYLIYIQKKVKITYKSWNFLINFFTLLHFTLFSLISFMYIFCLFLFILNFVLFFIFLFFLVWVLFLTNILFKLTFISLFSYRYLTTLNFSMMIQNHLFFSIKKTSKLSSINRISLILFVDGRVSRMKIFLFLGYSNYKIFKIFIFD